MNEITEHEREALQSFLVDGGLVRQAMVKFILARAVQMESSSASAIRAIPRQFDLAADYASKADVYRSLFADLAKFSQR